MTKEQWRRILRNHVLITGGAPYRSETPLTPQVEQDLYATLSEMAEAGALILLTPTCGVDGFHLPPEEASFRIHKLAALTQRAAGDKAFVAGMLSGEGCSVAPLGEQEFDHCVATFRAQAQALLDCGVSLFWLDGFTDILSARCALLAIKDICTLPVCVGLRFTADDAGHMSLQYGTDPVCAALILQSMGADAVGYSGPDCDDALDTLSAMRTFSTIPLLALTAPTGQFAPSPAALAEYLPDYVNNTCAVVGYCGADGDGYIAQLAKQAWQVSPFPPDFPQINAVTSYRDAVILDYEGRPVGRDDVVYIKLDKHAKVDEVVDTLIASGAPPAVFEADEEEILERALRRYPGRCGVKCPERLNWLIEEYGQPFITLEKSQEASDDT